jgi:hypothetical protein
MRDSENQEMLGMDFECHEIWKLIQTGFADGIDGGRGAWPDWIKRWRAFDAFENLPDTPDNLITQTRPPLVVPQRRQANLGTGFRMKRDAHGVRPARS